MLCVVHVVRDVLLVVFSLLFGCSLFASCLWCVWAIDCCLLVVVVLFVVCGVWI